jgi:ribosomal-protein-alanine N-acetyltransferase
MAILIETQRLILKPMSEEDAFNLFQLNNDPEVIRYTGDSSFNSIKEALNFIHSYKDLYNNYGCGRLSTFIKETGEYIGWCGLKYLPNKNITDIGYRFIKHFWGKGYATESAAACLDDGFKRLQLNKIIATAMKENIASINVFKKLGLKYQNDADCGCQPGVVYAITKEEWRRH